MHPGYTDFFGKLVSVNIWLTFVVIRYPRLRHYPFTSGFGDEYILIYIVNCWMTSKHTILLCIGWDLTLVRPFIGGLPLHPTLLFPATFHRCQRTFSLQGSEASCPGLA